jgi:hypothetical protein
MFSYTFVFLTIYDDKKLHQWFNAYMVMKVEDSKEKIKNHKLIDKQYNS